MEYKCVSIPSAQPSRIEDNDGTYLTDPSGYIPITEQITCLTASGKNLNDYRALTYGYSGPDDRVEPDLDPTTRFNYDRIDLQNDISYLADKSQRLAAQKASETPTEQKPEAPPKQSEVKNE